MQKKYLSIAAAVITAVSLSSSVYAVDGTDNTVVSPMYLVDETELDGSLFDESSKVFCGDLMRLSLVLAANTYSSDNTGKANILTAMNELGMEDVDDRGSYDKIDNLTKDDADYAAYAFGHKETVINGEACTLIAAAIKGTGSNAEWYSNFNVGTGTRHEGFNKTCGRMEAEFTEYVKENELDLSNAKIWICGHSRGAGVGNLFAADLVNASYGEGCTGELDPELFCGLDSEGIYAYLFAAPTVQCEEASAVDRNDSKAKYAGIYNIVDPNDIVPRFPVQQWGYKHFGKLLVLPNSLTCEKDEYSAYLEKLDERCMQLTGTRYTSMVNENTCANIIGMTNELSNTVKTAEEYYSKEFRTIGSADSKINMFAEMLGFSRPEKISAYTYFHEGVSYLLSHNISVNDINLSDMTADDVNALLILSNPPENSISTLVEYVSSGVLSGGVVYAHYPTSYMAACSLMESVDDFAGQNYSHLIITPAVDTEIFDENGDLVGGVTGGIPFSDGKTGIYSSSSLNSNDLFFSSHDAYTVRLKSDDAVSVDISLNDESLDYIETIGHNVSEVDIKQGRNVDIVINRAEETVAEVLSQMPKNDNESERSDISGSFSDRNPPTYADIKGLAVFASASLLSAFIMRRRRG